MSTNGNTPDKLIIEGIPPLDGEYEFDFAELLDSLTNREYHVIKVMTGVRAAEVFEAMEAGDTDLVMALAVIILRRRGKRVDEDRFWDAEAGTAIRIVVGSREVEEVEEDGPPAPAAEA